MAVTVQLSVWSPSQRAIAESTQPWKQDVMALNRHSDLEHYCKELGKQRHDHKKSREKEQAQERKKGERQKHGGERGEKERERGKGRKNRSKMGSSALRSPRST